MGAKLGLKIKTQNMPNGSQKLGLKRGEIDTRRRENWRLRWVNQQPNLVKLGQDLFFIIGANLGLKWVQNLE